MLIIAQLRISGTNSANTPIYLQPCTLTSSPAQSSVAQRLWLGGTLLHQHGAAQVERLLKQTVRPELRLRGRLLEDAVEDAMEDGALREPRDAAERSAKRREGPGRGRWRERRLKLMYTHYTCTTGQHNYVHVRTHYITLALPYRLQRLLIQNRQITHKKLCIYPPPLNYVHDHNLLQLTAHTALLGAPDNLEMFTRSTQLVHTCTYV